MAAKTAVANGNWSAGATWNGGTVPGNGDTVYANGYTVTIDQNVTIGGANNPVVTAGSFVIGCLYQIKTAGNTSWTAIGAAANTEGTHFVATGVGAGTGTATAIANLTNGSNATVGAVAGGGFNLSASGWVINAHLWGGNTATVLLTTGNNTVTVNGSIWGPSATNGVTVDFSGTGTLNVNAPTGFSEYALYLGTAPSVRTVQKSSGGGGTLNIVGSILVRGGAWSSAIFLNQGAGTNVTVNLTGNIETTATGGTQTGVNLAATSATQVLVMVGNLFAPISTACFAVGGGGTATVTITGNCYGAESGTGNSAALVPAAGWTVTLTGNVYGSDIARQSPGVNNIAGATFYLTGNVYGGGGAGLGAPGFVDTGLSNSNVFQHIGNTYDSAGGTCGMLTSRIHRPSFNQHVISQADGTGGTVTFYTADASAFSLPAQSDVRASVVYGSDNLIGTCAVPAAGSVALGVPVDNTTGTAVLSPAAVWDYAMSSMTEAGSIGARLKNAATTDITGSQIAAALTA